MRSSTILVAFVASSTYAFPWLRPDGVEALLNHPEAQAEIRKRLTEHAAEKKQDMEVRQLNSGLVGGLVTLLGGTLSAVLDNVLGLIPTDDAVQGLQKFPEGVCLCIHIDDMRLTQDPKPSTPTRHRARATSVVPVLALIPLPIMAVSEGIL